MKIIPHELFKPIRKDSKNADIPKNKTVGVYEMACMIAKKTKFRVSDIQEVLDEVGPCIYGILLSRRSAKFGNVVISSRWTRLKYPRYVRNEDGYWVFGYFMPAVQFDKMSEKMYDASDAVYSEEFIENLRYYFSKDIETEDDAKKRVLEIMKETCQLGKNTVVGEDGRILLIPGLLRQAKTYKFDEDFHPSWFDKQIYYNVRRHYIKEMKKLQKEDPTINYKWVIQQLKNDGFIKYHENDLENISEENEDE